MLEDATPRAQLHVQRIMSKFGDGANGDITTKVGALIRSSPSRQFMMKSRVNFMTLQGNSTLGGHTDTREKVIIAGSAPNSNGYRGSAGKCVTMPPRQKGASNLPRVKPSRVVADLLDLPQEVDSRQHSLRRDKSTENSSQKLRQGVSAPCAKLNLLQDSSSRETELGDVLTDTHTRLDVISTSPENDIRHQLQHVEMDETFGRQFMEELIDFYAEDVRQSRDREERTLKLLNDTASVLARVAQFLETPPEEVLRDPEWHLLRARDNTMQNHALSISEISLLLQRFPATIAANYERLMSVAHGVTEVEEPMPMLLIPQPHPHQQQQEEEEQQGVNLFGRGLSSSFSRCESAHLTGVSSSLRGGQLSPPGALVMSSSLDSVEDMPSSSTIIAHTAMRRMERETGTAWVVEDLQEESAYWQEETLRAMSEAERYIQMACTLLGSSPSSASNSTSTSGVGDIGLRKMSITAVGSNSQRLFVHRVYVQLLIEKEEGERGKIEAQEAKEWWNCWLTAWNTALPRNPLKGNGFAVAHHRDILARKSEDSVSCVQPVDHPLNAVLIDDSNEEGCVSSTRHSRDDVDLCIGTREEDAH